YAHARRLVVQLDRRGRVVLAEQLDRFAVGVTETCAVGTYQDRPRVDEVEQLGRHVVHAPVVGELEQIDLEARRLPFIEQPADRALQIGRVGIAGEQQRRTAELGQTR